MDTADGGDDVAGDDDDDDVPACEEVDRHPVSLVAVGSWTRTSADADPFGDERPAQFECEVGWGVENGVFEVDTEACQYGSFEQAALADIAAGDALELIVLHDALYDEEPAEAHLGVAIGPDVMWETTLPIPSPPGYLRPTWTATEDIPAGTVVHFHVHNHGYNNYRVVDVTRTRTCPADG